jgi:hypothetical protein
MERWSGNLALVIILLLLTGCIILPVSALTTDAPDPSLLRWGPYLTSMTTDSVTVNWRTEGFCRGTVWYDTLNGRDTGLFSGNVAEEQDSVLHHLRLVNLSPNRTYAYAISGSASEYSFRTFPMNGPIRFVVYGDTREQLPFWNQSTHHARVAERIAEEPDVLFVVHTGDLVNDPSDTGEWDRFFAAAGPMFSRVPFYPVAGNHEQDSGVLQEIFGMPLWYDIRCSDVRVVVLDSNPLPPAMMADQDLFIAENPGENANWTFVALHHPLYSADPNHPGGFLDVRERWEPVFRSWNVSAVFAAHVHAYEHFEQNGIHYFTVATGGAPSYSLSPNKPEGYVTSLENTLGYAVVTVNATNSMIEFVEVANVQGTGIHLYLPGTVYERVVLDKQFGTVPGLDVSGFPIIFTSHFGDTKIKMLN